MNDLKNKFRFVRSGVESNAKSINARHPFADIALVRDIVQNLGYATSPHGISGMRKINIGRDFLCVVDF